MRKHPMTHWLSTQVRTLGALAGLALLLGLSAPASAREAKPAAGSAEARKKAKAKGKRTAQAAPKGKKAQEKKHAPAAKPHRGKTAQAHAQPSRRAQPPQGAEEKDDCLRDPVEINRLSGEGMKLSLTRCKGKPADQAVERLSVLMRPYSVPRPASLPGLTPKQDKGLREGEISPGIHAADPGLLSRLQAIASEFPGHTITVVSGYRPGGTGAYHRHGKAIDVRVEGVKTETLATFCRSLLDTGCGYYPNGGFVHVDVRPKGTGHVYWIDAAGPGEPSQFVSSWPPRKDDEDEKVKPGKGAPKDDTSHGDVKKKAGHGAARADRDHEDDE
jgi:hypothetical protein